MEQGSWKGEDVDAIFGVSPETRSSSVFGASAYVVDPFSEKYLLVFTLNELIDKYRFFHIICLLLCRNFVLFHSITIFRLKIIPYTAISFIIQYLTSTEFLSGSMINSTEETLIILFSSI